MAEDRRKVERRAGNQDGLLTDEQVARMAKVPVRTVRYWRNSGILPFVKVGRHPRIWLSDFQKTFHKPPGKDVFEPIPKTGKIGPAWNIRRRS